MWGGGERAEQGEGASRGGEGRVFGGVWVGWNGG